MVATGRLKMIATGNGTLAVMAGQGYVIAEGQECRVPKEVGLAVGAIVTVAIDQVAHILSVEESSCP